MGRLDGLGLNPCREEDGQGLRSRCRAQDPVAPGAHLGPDQMQDVVVVVDDEAAV